MLRNTDKELNAYNMFNGAAFLTTIAAAFAHFNLSIINIMIALKAAYSATSNNDLLDNVTANWTITTRQWTDQAANATFIASDLGDITMLYQFYGPLGTGGQANIHTVVEHGNKFAQPWKTGMDNTYQTGLQALNAAPSDTGSVSLFRQATGIDAGKWQCTYIP